MARNTLKLILFLIFVFNCFSGFSAINVPVPIDSVDYTRIQHKKVRKLISRQKHYGVRTFDEIIPVCYNTIDSGNYRTYTKSQLIRQDINVVWNNLIHQSPSTEFDGRIVTFGLLYSKRHNNFLYTNESYEGIEEGQILFFNLRVLSGIKNLAVALEVTRMDIDHKEIEYCYVDHGDTKGTQKFTLTSTSEGFTEITQLTRYKCKSRLRDRRLYSFFHERIVKEFFNTIKIKSEKPAMVVEM
jgi:hypothetical protein